MQFLPQFLCRFLFVLSQNPEENLLSQGPLEFFMLKYDLVFLNPETFFFLFVEQDRV